MTEEKTEQPVSPFHHAMSLHEQIRQEIERQYHGHRVTHITIQSDIRYVTHPRAESEWIPANVPAYPTHYSTITFDARAEMLPMIYRRAILVSGTVYSDDSIRITKVTEAETAD